MGRRSALPGFLECLSSKMAAMKQYPFEYFRRGLTQLPIVSGGYLIRSGLFTAQRGRGALPGRFAGSLDDRDDPERDSKKAGPKAMLAAPNKLPAEV